MRTILLSMISILALCLPAACDDWVAGVEQFPFKSTGVLLESGEWEMKANGYMGTFVVVPKACRVALTVSAAGRDAVMHLHVGDKKFVHSVNGAEFADYRCVGELPAGTHAVRIELTNARPGRNCSLRLKRMQVSGNGVKLGDTSNMDALVLAAADSYIENYRKGAVEIALTGANGKPLPAGKQVKVKLRTHSFNFGTAVYGTNISNADWLASNPAPGSDASKYQEFVNTHFNTIVPENAGKWGSCEGAKDVETMDLVDAMMGYARKHGMRARMHCVIWGQNPPAWVEKLLETAQKGADEGARIAAKTELREQITGRINCLVKDRANSYIELDGINESQHQDGFLKIYGPGGIGGIYDEIIDASGGRARVYFNEFNLFQWSQQAGKADDYANWYRDHIESIINSGISAANRSELGIGMQYYPSGSENARKNSPHSAVRISKVLQLLSVFEYPMSLTEFAAGDDGEAFAPQFMSETMRLVFGSDQATSFLVWGFWHKHMWAKGSAMVDDNWNLTDCGKTYEQLMGIHDWGIKGIPIWTTDLTLKTGKNGRVSFRGFYGDYDVTINGRTHHVKVAPGKTKLRLKG